MCITTFLHDGELNIPTSNDEINKLLSEIRFKTGDDWQVIEHTQIISSAFGMKKEEVKYYEIYKFVGGMGPWQLINFYRDKMTSSINIRITAELVIAYFYGILVGIHSCEKINEN